MPNEKVLLLLHVGRQSLGLSLVFFSFFFSFGFRRPYRCCGERMKGEEERGRGERKVRAAQSALLLKLEGAGDSGAEQKKRTARTRYGVRGKGEKVG